MNLQLKPELERFIDDQVKEGRFATPVEVVEAGIARLMLDLESDELDETDVATIGKSIDQMHSGAVIDWSTFSTEMRKPNLNK